MLWVVSPVTYCRTVRTLLGAERLAPGHFQYTASQATNHLNRFYLVRSP